MGNLFEGHTTQVAAIGDDRMRWLLAALKYALFAVGVALVAGMAFERHWHAILVAAAVIDFAGFWVCDRLVKTR